jgi:hypothetical protein
MGRYAEQIKQKTAQAAVDDLLSKVSANSKLDSLAEVLAYLSQVSDGTTKLSDTINAAITTAIGEGGAIATWAAQNFAAKTE